ncbi:MAG: hypothetical protein RIQ90_152 [Bacteroidota bacterium]
MCFRNFVTMKLALRIVALLFIFMIWGGVFALLRTYAVSQKDKTLRCPSNTIGIIKINPRALFGQVLFDFTFRNNDKKMLELVSKFLQTNALRKEEAEGGLPIDYQEEIALIKIKSDNQMHWLIAGRYSPNGKSKDESGYVYNNTYYQVIAENLVYDPSYYKALFKNSNGFNTSFSETEPVVYDLYENQRMVNRYAFNFNKNKVTVHFARSNPYTLLSTPKNPDFFHLSSTINKGSFLPSKYSNIKNVLDNLSSFSLNYYGARYVEDVEKPYLDFDMDLLLSFSKPTSTASLNKIFRSFSDVNVSFFSNELDINGAKFLYKSLNDSTIFIGKNRPQTEKTKSPFQLYGNPSVLTRIQGLGMLKQSILELIPEYRTLKDFSQSVYDIRPGKGDGEQVIEILFKENHLASMELVSVLLTITSLYQN